MRALGAQILSALGRDQFDIVGLSFGAVLAHNLAHVAEATGGSPRRVVLMDPAPAVSPEVANVSAASGALWAAKSIYCRYAHARGKAESRNAQASEYGCLSPG